MSRKEERLEEEEEEEERIDIKITPLGGEARDFLLKNTDFN